MILKIEKLYEKSIKTFIQYLNKSIDELINSLKFS